MTAPDIELLLRGERGELAGAERKRYDTLVREDAESARFVDFVGAVRGAVGGLDAEAAGDCPDEMAIAALGGRAPGSEETALHVSHCGRCIQLLDAALGESTDSEPVDPATIDRLRETAPSPGGPLPRLSRPWIVPLAAAAILLVVFWPRPVDPASLARIEPLPIRVQRELPEPGSFEAARREGLVAYQDGDYRRAADRLEAAAALRASDAETLIYLGSALLLSDRPELAAARFRDVLDLRAGMLEDEARWQLAQIELLAGNAERAADLLRELGDPRAAELLAEIERS